MIFQCPLREYWRNIFISETLFWQAGKVQLDIQKNFWNFNNSKERESYDMAHIKACYFMAHPFPLGIPVTYQAP